MIQQIQNYNFIKPKELSLLNYHPRFDLNQTEFLPSVREKSRDSGVDHISQTPVECSIFIYWHGTLLLSLEFLDWHLQWGKGF